MWAFPYPDCRSSWPDWRREAVPTPLLDRIARGGSFRPLICNHCLEACPGSAKTIYCISRALIEAVKGNKEDGLFFCGANAWRLEKMTTVPELMKEYTEGLFA